MIVNIVTKYEYKVICVILIWIILQVALLVWGKLYERFLYLFLLK